MGSTFLAFLVIALLGVLSLSLGILLSSLAKREPQAIQFVSIVALPVLLLGCFWLVEGRTGVDQAAVLRYPANLHCECHARGDLRGWGIGQIWVELAVMSGFTVVCLGLAVLLLRRDGGR